MIGLRGSRRLQSPGNTPELDAVIIFHHEWEALHEAARSFRRNYEFGELLIARDTMPIEKTEILESLGAKYLPTFSTTQFFIDLKSADRGLETISGIEFLNKVNQDLARMTQVVQNSKSDYILFMEADSYVQSKVVVDDIFDMDTLDANRYAQDFLSLVNDLSGRRLPVEGWGFVTGYVKTNSLKESILWAENNNETLVKLFDCDPRFTYLDHFLPIVFHLAGFKIYKSGQVGECLRDKAWEKKTYTLLHQYRLNY